MILLADQASWIEEKYYTRVFQTNDINDKPSLHYSSLVIFALKLRRCYKLTPSPIFIPPLYCLHSSSIDAHQHQSVHSDSDPHVPKQTLRVHFNYQLMRSRLFLPALDAQKSLPRSYVAKLNVLILWTRCRGGGSDRCRVDCCRESPRSGPRFPFGSTGRYSWGLEEGGYQRPYIVWVTYHFAGVLFWHRRSDYPLFSMFPMPVGTKEEDGILYTWKRSVTGRSFWITFIAFGVNWLWRWYKTIYGGVCVAVTLLRMRSGAFSTDANCK